MICGNNQEIGSKAYNLCGLQERQICIPATTVLTDEMCASINGLKQSGKTISEICAVLEEKGFFVFENDIRYPFIVRSSSVDEDNEKRSNAGKYLSIYNCTSRSVLIQSVINCWNSKNGDEAMGVIIQEQLFPYCSGVAFVSGTVLEPKLVAEGIIGLGELLVSGYVTPATYLYDPGKDDFSLLKKSTQRVAEFPLKDSNIVPTDDFCVDGHPFRVMNLRKNVCYALCDYTHDYWKDARKVLDMLKRECIKILDSFGASDIEWVYSADGKLYIVQRRPITTEFAFDADPMGKDHGRKNNGTTIVSGKAVGKLVSLSEYQGEDDVIVFANMFLPQDIIRLSNARGIISVECSLLSHCSILAREYGIPYWAGADLALFENAKGQIVAVDFDKKEITRTTTVKHEVESKQVEEPFEKILFDPISLKYIPEKELHTVSTAVKDWILRYYDADFYKKVWG